LADPPNRPSGQAPSPLPGLERLVAQLPALLWTTDTDLRFTSSDGMGLRGLGLTPGEVVGRSLYEYFDTTDRSHPAIANHIRALDGEQVAFEMEFADRWFITHVLPLRAPDGRIVGTIGLAVDVTDSKRMERALRQSEAHYRALVEHAPVGIYRASVEGRFLTVNQALATMLGYESVEALLALEIGRDLYVDPVMRLRLMERYATADHVAGEDVEWRRKDGARITVRLSGRPVRDLRGRIECWEMVAEDVTERRRLEAQLRTAQKMEALGLVTGGVAHDFNNLLTTILANAELIGSALPPTFGQIRSDLLEIQDAAARGREMVKKLLGFSRRERLTMQPADLGAVVEEMVDVLRRLVPERIEVTAVVEPDLPQVMADTGAVQQILVALATNARDAIAENGDIRVEVRRARLDAAHVAEFGWGTPGDYVAVAVHDSGLGMDEPTRARVFEPFFTTKPMGSGAGLGLSMVYGLMKQQNGFVDVQSRPGSGTTVTLYLPVTGRRTTMAAPRAPASHAASFTGTALIVEDEDPIRRVAQRVLERFGFKVLAAADGLEALHLFREHEAEVVLIVTDVVMPRMGGRALYETLRGAGKAVPIIFTSGYAARDAAEAERLDPSLPYLPKPWTVEQLLEKVRSVLQGPGHRSGSLDAVH
jgi:two-component system cell cycle sensor histidine kinase/response regulator CckA